MNSIYINTLQMKVPVVQSLKKSSINNDQVICVILFDQCFNDSSISNILGQNELIKLNCIHV